MKTIIFYCLILSLSFLSCQDTSHKAQLKSNLLKTEGKGVSSSDSVTLLDRSDVYKYENDTILQLAYVHYLAVPKILFWLKTVNKRDQMTVEIHDTAELPMPIADPDTYDDELEAGNLYPVYEFVNQRGPSHITIGIEPSRGKRLAVTVSKDVKKNQNVECPIESIGTLRRIRLSSVKQSGPSLPRIPS